MADVTCAVEGCDRTGKLRRGWCGKHYQRFAKHGAPGGAEAPPRTACSVADCSSPAVARELCTLHYTRQRTTGTTNPRPPREPRSAEAGKQARRDRYEIEKAQQAERTCTVGDCDRIANST